MVDDPLVSIIIVNWNGWHYLKPCLTALDRQTFTNFEVIVVDNASTDGSVEALQHDYPTVHLIKNTSNLGFAAANNQALPACRGSLIALLNNDTVAEPGWLAALVDTLAAAPTAAGACGQTRSLREPDRTIFTTPKIDPVSAAAIWINQPAPPCRVDYLTGYGMLIRRTVVDRLGLFDEAYIAYYEETDWCARAIRAGYDLLYVPTAVIAHREQGSAAADFHFFQMIRNRLRFALKNFDRAVLPWFLLAFSRDLVWLVLQNLRYRRPSWNWLLLRALGWNLLHLPETLAVRRRETMLLTPQQRSYNRSLPLRDRQHNGAGGWR